MKLRVGMPLATKNGQRLSNAVVYKIAYGKDRDIITVLTDYGNIRHFPSVDDLFENYDIMWSYLDFLPAVDNGLISLEDLDDAFSIRDRLEHQIDLLKSALEGLE